MAEKEYIEREAAKNSICQYCRDIKPENCEHKDECNVICRLDAIPAADVVPVVLCRDCKCYQQSSFVDKHMECARSRFPVHPVDFCSLGEKREES